VTNATAQGRACVWAALVLALLALALAIDSMVASASTSNSATDAVGRRRSICRCAPVDFNVSAHRMQSYLNPLILVVAGLLICAAWGACVAGFARYWGWPVIVGGSVVVLLPAVFVLVSGELSQSARTVAGIVAIASAFSFFFGFVSSMLVAQCLSRERP
jgi:hypothetical protein